MKRLYLHHPLFRILYPTFFGCLVYVLALLIFGTTRQLTEHFFSAEAMLCVGLAYLLAETLRLGVLVFDRLYPDGSQLHLRMLLQTLASFAASVLVISTGVSLYFTYVVGYSGFSQELLILNALFLVGTLLYNVVFYGIQLLNRHNRERLRQQEALRQKTSLQLANLRHQVKPDRLFHSLESLLSLIPHDAAAADLFLQHLAALYRYSLETRHQDLVPVQRELRALSSLLHLRSQPLQSAFTFHLDSRLSADAVGQLIPGSLLQLVERILDTTIINSLQPFLLDCHSSDSGLVLSFAPNDKLQQPYPLPELVAELAEAYSFYSPVPVKLQRKYGLLELHLPVLKMQPKTTALPAR